MTNLTPKDDPEELMPTPDPGEEIRSGGILGMIIGAVRPGFQVLFNKVYSVFVGRVGIRSLFVAGLAADVGKRVADGDLPRLGEIKSTYVTTGELEAQGAHVLFDGLDVNGLAGDVAWMDGGALYFTNLSSGAGGGNQPATQALKNRFPPSLLPKAWLLVGTQPFRVLDGANFKSVAAPNALLTYDGGSNKTTLVVTLAEKMAGTNYQIWAEANAAAAPGASHSAYEKRATSDEQLVAVFLGDMVTADHRIQILIFGRQGS